MIATGQCDNGVLKSTICQWLKNRLWVFVPKIDLPDPFNLPMCHITTLSLTRSTTCSKHSILAVCGNDVLVLMVYNTLHHNICEVHYICIRIGSKLAYSNQLFINTGNTYSIIHSFQTPQITVGKLITLY